MKSRVINNCRYVFEVIVEKIMEMSEHFRFKLKRARSCKSSLVEIYKISNRHIDEEYVLDFLKEREKQIGPNRHKIEIKTVNTPDEEEIIGEVMLMRKNKIIERATLIIKKNIPEEEKLIYWRF